MGANERLGLPFGQMEKIIFCFDVDGTLIDSGPKYYDDIIQMVKTVSRFKNVRVVVWSGGGKPYAERWVRLLRLEDYVWRAASKTEWREIRKLGHIIAVDDIQDTAIGNVNLIVRNK